ncbi:MAG: magnesium transporter [Candidatus Omnitrophica bacterium]|nr:magnesium transporter [Candidatus Omnitrophota bacterium]
MLTRLILPDIEAMLAQKNYKELREALIELDPVDIAETINTLTAEERAIVFRILPRNFSADVFEYLPFDEQEELMHSLGREQVSALLNDMDPDDRTQLLEELPGKVTKRVMELLTPQERSVAVTLLGYPEDSVGRRMTPEYTAIHQGWTVEQTILHVRKIGREKETINILYVVDDNDHLIAYVKLRSLIFSEPTTLIKDIMNQQVIALNAFDDQESASEAMIRYDLPILPVVDSDGTLVGIVTSDDVFDVVVEETTEDMHRMGGLSALEEPYFNASFLTLVRKRGGWLLLLFLGEMIVVSVMESFETTIQGATALVLFLPLVISSGGNSGSQAATLVIRALAVQDVRLRDWFRVFQRELLSGFILGAFLGSIAFIRVYIWPGEHPEHWILLGSTITLAVTSVVLCGALLGSMLPFLLRSLGFDPALSSTPLVATLSDTIGVIIYFTLSIFLLQGTIL